jgi:hypothetical protein
MPETNPRFQTQGEVHRPRRRTVVPFRQSAAQGPALPYATAGGFTMDLAGDVTEEPQAVEFAIEPAYPVADALRTLYLPVKGQQVEFLIVVDDAHLPDTWGATWHPANQEPPRFTVSQATAFSMTEALRGKSGHLTRYLRSLSQLSYGRMLAERVEELSSMVREESEGELALSADSLATLISFLEQNPRMNRPGLVAGPSGELLAIWRGGPQSEFTARFMPNGTVRYLLTKPNAKHPLGASRVTGDTTSDKLSEEARLGELRWMTG